MKQLSLFLPHIATYQIEDLDLFGELKEKIVISPLNQDWQNYFCETVGYAGTELPWTKLLLDQFNIEPSVKTACCCRPVVMQLTHRGAYMVGQNQLQLSANDAIRIVTKINEQLMDDGERLYLVDKYHWLYTSKKALSLKSESINDLIGKDLFNHSYGGDDAQYWLQLNNEIQMLIKQMADYKELPETSTETMLNVHFSDLINPGEPVEVPFIKNNDILVISDNEMIESFCMNTFLTHQPIHDLEQPGAENNVIIAFDSEREVYPSLIKHWLNSYSIKSVKDAKIVCQDSMLRFDKRNHWLSRLFKS